MTHSGLVVSKNVYGDRCRAGWATMTTAFINRIATAVLMGQEDVAEALAREHVQNVRACICEEQSKLGK